LVFEAGVVIGVPVDVSSPPVDSCCTPSTLVMLSEFVASVTLNSAVVVAAVNVGDSSIVIENSVVFAKDDKKHCLMARSAKTHSC